MKRHKQGARGHTLVRLATALLSTRPLPLASLLHPIVYVVLIGVDRMIMYCNVFCGVKCVMVQQKGLTSVV